MDAGRELDAVVAEKVMGMHKHPNCDLDDNLKKECYGTGPEEGYGYLLEYSTSIAAAWLVVEKLLLLKHGHLDLSIEPDGVNCVFTSYERDGEALAATAPLAICLAALKTMEVT